MIITSIVVIMASFKIYPFPVRLSPEESMVKDATNWVKAAGLSNKKIIFNDLNVPFYMGMDPYNGAVCAPKWFVNHRDPSPNAIPDSAVFIWDSHFGPNECQVPLDSLMMNPHYQLINRFLPAGELKTLGGYDYEVYVFLRLPVGMTADNQAQLDLLKKAAENNLRIFSSKKLDFEEGGTVKDTLHYTNKTAFSGSWAYKVGPNKEFSPGPGYDCSSLPANKDGLSIRVEVAVFTEVSFRENPTSLIISVEHAKESYYYSKFSMEEKAPAVGEWNLVDVIVSLPEFKSSRDKIKIYLWHEGKKEFLMDAMKVDILVKKK